MTLVTNPLTMEVADIVTIIATAVITGLFVYAPILIIIGNEFNKMTRSNEKEQGIDDITIYFFVLFAALPIAEILFRIVLSIFAYLFQMADNAEAYRVFSLFWDMSIPSTTSSSTPFDSEFSGMQHSLTNSFWFVLEMIRMFLKSFSYITIIIILSLTIKSVLGGMRQYLAEDGKGIVSLVLKVFIGFILSVFIIIYYNENSIYILNYQNKGVWDLSASHLKESVNNAVLQAGGNAIF